MFDESNCAVCENIDCLTRCQWIDLESGEEAQAEMMRMIDGGHSRVLEDCVTCFACDEYCPYNSHPFDLFVNLQEKHDAHGVNPKIIEGMVQRYKPHEELRVKEIDPEKPVLNKCVFFKSHGKHIQGELFDDLQYIQGRDFFCNLMYHHFERDSVIQERVPKIIENIKKTNVKKMICFHDECYGLYASYCPRNNIEVPFEPIHIFEYISDYLKQNKEKITKLNAKIAYQRNCSNRFIPETDKWVDEICELIGVERVDREYDRENALCCAAPFAMLGKRKLVRPTQNKNIKDAVKHDAEYLIFNCPMCMDTVGSKAERKGLKIYLLSDLVRMALGEELGY
ncbi:MAG: heterodisulfide reductase-related iron-sulfur binding cluster [Promethearchaeia archaeon]